MPCYSADHLVDWASRILQTTRVTPDDATLTARLLVRSDLRGSGTHGLGRLASYVDRLQQGDFNPQPDIRFQRNGAVWTVDADGALGQVAGQRVIDSALLFLVNEPLLWVSLRQTGHLGALGVLAVQAAESGVVCLMGQRTPPLLGLPGFCRPAIGHNPFAFACPAGDERPPLVFDMACSVAARGHILLAAREGKSLPADWALDASGLPTTDADAAITGMLQPTGGYKGMGLAMMIECIAAAIGADVNSANSATMKMPPSGAVPRESAFFFFINPATVGDAQAFSIYMNHWMSHYVQSAAGHSRLPGERGDSAERAGRADGIAYSATIEAELRRLGERLSVAMPDPI